MNLKIATLELLTIALLKGVRADFATELEKEIKYESASNKANNVYEKFTGKMKTLDETKTKNIEDKAKLGTKNGDAMKKLLTKTPGALGKGLDKFKQTVGDELGTFSSSKSSLDKTMNKKCVDAWKAVSSKLRAFSKFGSTNKGEFEKIVSEFKKGVDKLKEKVKKMAKDTSKEAKTTEDKISEIFRNVTKNAKRFSKTYSQGKKLKADEKTEIANQVKSVEEKVNSSIADFKKKLADDGDSIKKIEEDVGTEFETETTVKDLKANWKKFFASDSDMTKLVKGNYVTLCYLFDKSGSVGALFTDVMKELKERLGKNPLKDYIPMLSGDFTFDGSEPAVASGDETTSAKAPVEDKAAKSGYNWLLIAGISAVALIVIGVIIYFVTARSK